MKIKLFYQKHKQSLEEFEKRVNDFMAGVEVINVTFQVATHGDYEDLSTFTTVLITYK
ncbi:hypothetical protein ACTGJ2_10395 [Streptococcus suis]|uniref:DUF2758 domain-containing protein n=1 Tax=Streptococcus suis TaxID=1307 RepID=A0A9Q5BTG5_STRSU|nr:hypothetical protein [Streptococcus suis]QBX11645.1 hypothetical protein JavanS598_0007 [Streptococcus satellite phage Javan598]MCK3847448.1 hypothetical protein [Streptococcus suis]MCK3907366.1 hypothetical protein [Streptococcus suis]MCK3959074.1 hypothetical protein [Streptococcus suis]MCK4064624.1 hypothetical protein [Streptococcus suis]